MSSIKMSAHLGQKGWNTKTIGLQFASGVNAVLAYNPSCKQDPYSNDVSVKDCVSVLYDVSGYSAPNTSSKDLRGYNVLSLGSKNCLYEIGNSCYSGISRPTGLTFAECEAVKDKLGIQNCYYGNNGLAKDMWAGAVLACGGIQYMPTPEQLKELANYLYKDNNGTKELDNDKVAQLGLNLSSGGYFYLWSNAEMDGNTCLGSFCTYAYWATGPTTRGGNHTNTDRRFICVGK